MNGAAANDLAEDCAVEGCDDDPRTLDAPSEEEDSRAPQLFEHDGLVRRAELEG